MTSRKAYDNMARDQFARDVGIDIGDERGVFDDFHRIEVELLKENHAREIRRLTRRVHRIAQMLNISSVRNMHARRRLDESRLIAVLGWGMFAIACLMRLTK